MNFWKLLPVLLIAGLFLAWLIWQPGLRARRRRRLQATPLPDEWKNYLQRHLPLYRRLPAALKQQLHGHIQVFLAEKHFTGCDGLAVTDAMRLTIAAHACLLLLNRQTDYYPGLSTILVYPAAFVVDRESHDHLGLHYLERLELTGESWDSGKVVISWRDACEDACLQDGYNVVLHEFAHQLDAESGEVNGAPLLPTRADAKRWARVMAAAYDRHCANLEQGIESILDEYAAHAPEEFFAVASEAFFETPARLRGEYPALYQEFCRYYQVDPAQWGSLAAL
jgi:Mlc titration factor MtfA (ptsG expression regulator)